MTETPFSTPAKKDPPRDGWQRPLIAPPGGGKLVPYTRMTTFIDCVEDTSALTKWKMRQVAKGVASRTDLSLGVIAAKDDKRALDRLAQDAMDAAASSAAATIGTALHSLTELVDKGESVDHVPDLYRADLEAYRQAMAPFEILQTETFAVLDDLKVGGTYDRILGFNGRQYIGDVKTGGIEYGGLKRAMQLAGYAHAVRYDPETGERTPNNVDQDRGLIIHLPQGKGECTLHWVDLRVGWEALQLAAEVRRLRSLSGKVETDFDPAAEAQGTIPLLDLPGSDRLAANREPVQAPVSDRTPEAGRSYPGQAAGILQQIQQAGSVAILGDLWRQHHGEWQDEFTKAAGLRKKELEGTFGFPNFPTAGGGRFA